MFSKIFSSKSEPKYPEKLQSFLRKSDAHLQETCLGLVTTIQRELYEMDSVDEFRDIASLYDLIPADLIEQTLKMLPKSEAEDV